MGALLRDKTEKRQNYEIGTTVQEKDRSTVVSLERTHHLTAHNLPEKISIINGLVDNGNETFSSTLFFARKTHPHRINHTLLGNFLIFRIINQRFQKCHFYKKVKFDCENGQTDNEAQTRAIINLLYQRSY